MKTIDYVTISLSVIAIAISIAVAYLQFRKKTNIYAKLLSAKWQVLSEEEVGVDERHRGEMVATKEGGWVPGAPQTLITIGLDLIFINNGDLPVSIIDVFVNATSMVDQSKERV